MSLSFAFVADDKHGVNWSAVGWFVGSLCLGSVIGWLVRLFLTRQKKVLTPTLLRVVVSVMTGGLVLKFLTFWHFWLQAYCIGLLVGVVAYRWIEMEKNVTAST